MTRDRSTHRVSRPVAAVLVLAAGAVTGAAGTASATTVIGLGNGASNNACSNLGGAAPHGATTSGPGVATGLRAGLPTSGPANQCGNLGVPHEHQNLFKQQQTAGGNNNSFFLNRFKGA